MTSRPKRPWRGTSGPSVERHGKPAAHAAALPQEQAIFGFHAAEAAIANSRRGIKHAYLTENAAAKLGPALAARRIPTAVLQPQDFDALLGASAVHQGIALHVEPLPQPSLDAFLDALPEGSPAAVAMLDQVTDPHNVGAVLRSAAAFNIGAVIVQDRHSPPLSGTLAKAASGALEHVSVIATVNLTRALERLKEHDFHCIGFDSDADSLFEPASVSASRIAFVFGAEDKGLRRLVRENCNILYALSAPGKIKSLNISNAAAIVFYENARKKKP
jgi:23S rRNA (guanosine2251-2'-O)-methyltransferase